MRYLLEKVFHSPETPVPGIDEAPKMRHSPII